MALRLDLRAEILVFLGSNAKSHRLEEPNSNSVIGSDSLGLMLVVHGIQCALEVF